MVGGSNPSPPVILTTNGHEESNLEPKSDLNPASRAQRSEHVWFRFKSLAARVADPSFTSGERIGSEDLNQEV